MAKNIVFNSEAREKIRQGVNVLGDAVRATMGPKGRNAILERSPGSPLITNDGVTIAKEIELIDNIENMGAQIVKEAAIKTNDIAGDGTSTATVLAQAIIHEGFNACTPSEDISEEEKTTNSLYKGANPILLKKGIELATKIAIDELKAIAKPIETDEEIKQIATISSANEEIGDLISKAIKKVGKDGIITTTESHTIETTLEIKEGFEFDRGFYSPYFANDQEKIESVYYNPLILVSDQKMKTQQEIVPLLEQILQINRPIVFIVDEIEQIVFSSLLRNKMNGMDVAVIKAPGFGAKRKELLQDIAILTGATFISEEYALTMSEARVNLLGSCESIKITKNNTIIFNGSGDKEEINKRAEHIKNSINAENISEYDKEKLEERLAKITGGIATIKIGAATEPELKEKKLRIEDAINATKAAIEEGIVPGGGTALFNLSPVILEKTKDLVGDVYQGALCVALAVNSPIIQIAINAGVDANKVMSTILKKAKENNNSNIGYDAYNDKYVDMLEAGIIDPVKVTRNALQNASSVSAILLTTNVTISNYQ